MLTLVFAAALAQVPADVAQTTLTAPQTVATIDLGSIKGTPSRLAWSADGRELYLQMAEKDGAGNIKSARQFLINIADKKMKSVDTEPAWVARYWNWKSAQASPANASFKIEVEQRTQTVRATSAPTGGALAKGAVADPTAGTTMSDAASVSMQNQTQQVYTLRAKGEVLGEWINEPVMPGVNFAWAPAPARVLAYAKRTGGPIILVDDQGHKQELAGPKEAMVPAFSEDGSRLAWLDHQDRKHLTVMVAGIGGR